MKFTLRVVMICIASAMLMSCKSIDTRHGGNQQTDPQPQPDGLNARKGDLVLVLDPRTGEQRTSYLVGDQKMLFPGEQCVIGRPGDRDFKEDPGLKKYTEEFGQSRPGKDLQACVATPPNRGKILDVNTTTTLVVKNPHQCWFCFLVCRANNVCDQLCYPPGGCERGGH